VYLIEAYSKVLIVTNLSDAVNIQNGLKQRDVYRQCFSTLLKNSHQERPRNQKGLELNGTCSLLVCIDNVNMLG